MGTALGSADSLSSMPAAKGVPTDGPERLIFFVKQRLADLDMTQAELAARGGPNRSTLGKLRGRPGQKTPTVATLLACDDSLGWERGSAAVVLLGGVPQEAADSGIPAGLNSDEKVVRLLGRANRRADTLGELLDSATREFEHLRRQLDALGGQD